MRYQIGGRLGSTDLLSAIWAMTLRWLAAEDLITAYADYGGEHRIAVVLDGLRQVEMLVVIATNLLDQRDAAN